MVSVERSVNQNENKGDGMRLLGSSRTLTNNMRTFVDGRTDGRTDA